MLKDALKGSAQDTEPWAYTETMIIRDKKGMIHEENVVRFDPSSPTRSSTYRSKIGGSPPTEKHLKKYRKEGEKRGRASCATQRRRRRKESDDPPKLSINDDKAVRRYRASLGGERRSRPDHGGIPLRAEKGSDIPAEKFQILAQVGKSSRQVERVWFRVKEESFRMALVAKIKKGEARIDFTVVDPNFGPVMTSLARRLRRFIFFIPFNATVSNTRTGVAARPRAYDERFGVKMAPLRLLGF